MKRIRIATVIVLLLGTLPLAAEEQDSFEKKGWRKIKDLKEFPEKKEPKEGSQKPFALLTIEDPPIKEANHLVAGEIRFSDVAGTGYLEMWTWYEDGSHFFSRTLGEMGPMAKLTGSSDWRLIMLPFFGKPDATPSKLQINVILPGGGKVEFRNFGLYQAKSQESAKSHKPQAWLPKESMNLIHSILGSSLGVLGGLVGVLVGTGRARPLAMSVIWLGIVAGILGLTLGIVTALIGQPRFVWYGFLIFGGIATMVLGIALPIARKAYTERELRAISAAG